MRVPAKVQSAWSRCFEGGQCHPVAGGLSSSRVWHLSNLDSLDFSLKAWPEDTTSEHRIRELHNFVTTIGRQHGFIPRLILPERHSSTSFLQHEGYFWEMTTWLDGEPLAENAAVLDHGRAAIDAVSLVHQSSRASLSVTRCSPSVEDRVAVLRGHLKSLPDLHRFASTDLSPMGKLAQQTLAYLRLAGGDLLEQLHRLREPVELIWVVRDLHREHMLFQGIAVSGIIDFGAARLDEPLIDLVRLLGSLWPLGCDVRHELVDYYARLNGRSVPMARFRILDQVSTLLSAMQWLRWLLVERRIFGVDQKQLLRRWQMLNDRLARNQW